MTTASLAGAWWRPECMPAVYILNDAREPVRYEIPTMHAFIEWTKWMTEEHCSVKTTYVRPKVLVSTVFLGVNHRWAGAGDPLLFETMVFGGPLNTRMDRYATWKEAEAGHEAMVREVQRRSNVG